MREEVASPLQRDTSSSRPPIAALIVAMIATQITSGRIRATVFAWTYVLIIIPSIVFALILYSYNRRPRIHSPTALALIYGQKLVVLATSIVVLGVRLLCPIESSPSTNNRINTRLQIIVTVLCSILTVLAFFFPVVSRTARTSPVFWLTLALTLILYASCAIPLDHLHIYLFSMR